MDATQQSIPLGGVLIDSAPSVRHTGALVVLVRLPEGSSSRWVTWIHSPIDGGYHWGHYHDDDAKAMADFQDRAVPARTA